jgi:putative MATE family efflux protein
MKGRKMDNGIRLGEEKVGKLLWKLAIPAIIAQLVSILYNVVDRIYIGHMPGIGDVALTGLGLCFPIIMIVSAFAGMIGQGGAPRVAIYMGRGQQKAAEEVLGNCVTTLIILAILLTIVLEISAEPVLRLFGASDNSLTYALPYLRIYILGTVFVMLSMGLNALIITQGHSGIGMATVIIGAVLNILLDPLFIFVFKMGVMGAAIASVISQMVSALWVLHILIAGKTNLKIKSTCLMIRPTVIIPVFSLGFSTFIMTATESALSIVFNISLARYGGDVAVGAMAIIASLMQFQTLPAQGIAQGAQPIISFNYGAGKIKRVRKTYRLLLLLDFGYTFIFWILIYCFSEEFVKIFNSNSQELLNVTVDAIRVYFAVSGIFGILIAIQRILNALGQAKLSLVIACLRKLILLIPLIYIMPMFFEDKLFAVFLAEPVADFLAISIASVLFALNIKKILAKV